MSEKLEAFAVQRPSTNLIPDAKYTLPAAEVKQGFLGVFTKKYSGDARRSLIKLALAPLMDTRIISLGRPPKPANEEEALLQKSAKSQMKIWEQNRALFYRHTKLKKVNGVDPHFVLNLPIFETTAPENLAMILSLFTTAPLPADAKEEIKTFIGTDNSQLFPTRLVLGNANVGKDLALLLEKCLLGVRYESENGLCLASLEFRVSEKEAEHLVSMEWIEIRPVDLYPLFSMWAAAEYESKFYGKSAISISKIASTLPAPLEGDERIDSYGVGIGLDGQPIYLPAKCDNSSKYESMYANVGANQDGSFSLSSLNPEIAKEKTKLPVNIPVLVDWVNFKFSYTNTQGRIEIMPLEHIRKCTASMAMNLLRSGKIRLSNISSWFGYATRSGVPLEITRYLTQEDIDGITPDDTYYTMRDQLQRARDNNFSISGLLTSIEGEYKRGAYNMNTYPTMMEFTSDASSPAWNFIHRFLVALNKGMTENLDALYVQYAVSTITSSLGWISMLANYGQDMAATRALANTNTKAALDQNVDPNWTPPAAPLITKKFSAENGGMLPHQAKVRNLLKDSPEFAVLSVDAGGGKSLLSITDVLYEIKEKRSAPYLIMCPSHLVANYVSEIVEFTDGMVNVLPITSYNIRTTGYARYEQMLEAAPINTILVVDYDALKFRARSAVYGTSAVAIYPVIEFIRKFRPGYCMLDESHLLKNAQSTRYKAVMSLIADIPKKRIASGTLNPDSPSDLPGQMAIMDPTVFGTREDFNERFAKGEYKGGRVREWQDNAGAVAIEMIKQNAVWAQAKRKEWACALPNREDRFLYVSLTDKQKDIYNALFDEMVMSIKKKAETDKNAKRLLDSLSGKKASKEDEDEFGDLSSDQAADEEDLLDDEGDIGAGLQPYLAAIEQYVSDPASHPYAKNGYVTEDGQRHPPLEGDDLKSPKALALAQDLTAWFETNQSKALVFVNYTATAHALFDAMPEELKATGFVYEASQKVEMVNRFKTDPKVRWMIGIRKSLEVGLNLQVAGLLVRMEGVWTPGEQEQGDSRIARPYFGPGGDKRPKLQFDTIVANHTIDVTKAARLRAKIVALAKFENAKDARYQEIDSIPVFPMTLEYIKTQNDFRTNLARYQESMAQLNEVTKQDYAEYRAKIEAEGGFKFTQIERGPNPPDARMLARVPYAQGTELYSAANLGLVRLDNFLGTEMSAEEDDTDEGGDEDVTDISQDDPRAESIRQQMELIRGLRCHTEYGEGEIIRGSAGNSSFINRVQVRLDDGTTARALRATNVFVVTRTETNSIDMRQALARAAGLEVVGEITVPGNNLTVTKITKKMQREEEKRIAEEQQREREKQKAKGTKKLSVSLRLSIINGYMRLAYVGADQATSKALQALGFQADQPYVYTRIQNYKHLINQASVWQEAGFNTSKEVDNGSFQMLAEELATGAFRTHKHYVRTVGGNFKNYLRLLWKPSADKKLLNLFALVTDGGADDPDVIRQAAKHGVDPSYGVAYLCMPYGAGFPATREAMRNEYRRPATKWFISENELSIFVNGLPAVKKVFQDLKDAGIQIANIDELERQARSVKKIAPKTDKTIDLNV